MRPEGASRTFRILSVNTSEGEGADIQFGSFAERVTTIGYPLAELPIGTVLQLGNTSIEIAQRGKECRQRCAIYQIVGECGAETRCLCLGNQ